MLDFDLSRWRIDLSRWRGLVVACSLLAGCGGGGGGAGDGGGGVGDNPTPGPAPTAAVVTAPLASGTYFEFLVNTTASSSSAAGRSTTRDHGRFRITLGAAQRVGGVDGFAVTVTGKSLGFVPAWTFLGQTGERWVASSDGVTLQTLYDPSGQGSGFFLRVPADRTLRTSAREFIGTYNRFPALALSDSASDGGCRTIVGETICSTDSMSFSQVEYLKDGVGPVGYSRRIGYSFGGSTPQAVNQTYDVELIASSLAPRDGSVILPAPWSDAAPLAVARSGGVAAGPRVVMFAKQGSAVRGFVHDPATGAWTPTANLTLASSDQTVQFEPWTHADGTTDVVAVATRGFPYMQLSAWRYMVATNRWTSIGTFETGARSRYTVAVIGDAAYLIGGYWTAYLGSIDALDLAAASYGRIRGTLSDGVDSVMTASLAGRLYVIGGRNGAGPRREVDILDPAAGTVSAGPAMFSGRHSAAVAVLDGKIYLIGGGDGEVAETTQVSVLKPR